MTLRKPSGATGIATERAMRAYTIVAKHPAVRERMHSQRLYLGQLTQIAEAVAEQLDVCGSTGFRLTRIALDLLGFGEADHAVNESKSPGPRGKNREVAR